MSAGNTIRFAAEFDDTKLIQGLNSVKSELQAVGTSVNTAFANQPGIQALEQDITGLKAELATLEQSTNAAEQSFTGLDSASTGLSGTFDEIGNAANQAGDNFDTMGTAGATIEQQLADIGTTSTTAGQSMTALGGSADTAGTSMGALGSIFTETTGNSDTLMQSLADSSDQFKGLGTEGETAGSKIKEAWSKGAGIAVGISAAVSGVANLVRGFRDYQDAQLRVNKTTVTLGKAQLAATDLQQKYNIAVAKYGANSAEAVEAGTKYQLKLDQIDNIQQQLAIQTKRMGDAQTDTWLGVAGTITGVGGSVMQVLTGLGGEKGLGGLKGALTDFKIRADQAGIGLLGLGTSLTIVAAGVLLADHLLKQDAKTMAEFAAAGIKLTTVQDDSIRSFAEMQKIIDVTHMSMGQIIADPAKAAEAYKAMNGAVDENGQIVLSNAEMMEGKPKSAFQMLAEILGLIKPEAEQASTGIKSITTATAGYIPTVEHLKISWRSIWKDGKMVTESYILGAKALDLYGLEQQKAGGTTNQLYEAFKKQTQASIEGAVKIGDFSKAVKVGNTVLHDHGAELLAGAQAQYGYDASVKKTIDDSTNYKTTLVSVTDEVNNSFGVWAKAGDIVVKVGQDYVDLGNATALQTMKQNDLKNGTNDYIATLKDALKINEQYNQEYEKGVDMMKEHAKESRELEGLATRLAKAFGMSSFELKGDIEVYQQMDKTITEINDAYLKEEQELFKVITAHKLIIPNLKDMMENTQDDTTAMKLNIATMVDWGAALRKGADNSALFAEGHKQATLEMEDFVKQAIISRTKTEDMDAMYAKLGQTMVGELHTTIPLTTEDFTELGKSFGDNIPLAEKLANIVESDLAPAFATFSEVIQAATHKDFKEAFKGLDLGDVGKKFKGELKDILEGMNEIAKSGKEVATVVSGLVVGALKGMSDKALGQGIEAIVEGFNKFKALDPDAAIVQPLINFVNNLPPASRAAGLLAIHQGLEDVSTAQATGNITTEKAMEIMGKYQPMIDKYNAAIAAGKSPTEALALATSSTGEAAGVAAPKLDSVAAALDSVNKAAADVATKMSTLDFEFAPPKLDQVAQAFTDVGAAGQQTADKIAGLKYNMAAPNIKPATDAFKSVEVNWKGYANAISKIIPTITVNNSQALSAIKAVVSAMNAVKNKTVTITTIKKTVTQNVGSSSRVGTSSSIGTSSRIGTSSSIGMGMGIGTETPIAALLGGGAIPMINTSSRAGNENGDINIQIHMKDEFGTEKIRKFKAAMGQSRFVFGTVGTGG